MSIDALSAPTSSGSLEGSESDELLYRAVSRAALGSVIVGILAILSLWSIPFTLLPFIGLLVGIVGLLNIRKYPSELTGLSTAWFGIGLNAAFAIVSPAIHTFTYLTEVPDGYARASFSALKCLNPEYDFPPEAALAMNGEKVFLKGYIHPTSIASGAAQRFILVPDLGTCCFGGQPKLTHMIEVNLSGENFARYSMRQVKVAGKLFIDTQLKPVADLQGVFYQMDADIYRGF